MWVCFVCPRNVTTPASQLPTSCQCQCQFQCHPSCLHHQEQQQQRAYRDPGSYACAYVHMWTYVCGHVEYRASTRTAAAADYEPRPDRVVDGSGGGAVVVGWPWHRCPVRISRTRELPTMRSSLLGTIQRSEVSGQRSAVSPWPQRSAASALAIGWRVENHIGPASGVGFRALYRLV